MDDIENQLQLAYKELKKSLTGQYGFMAFKDIFFEIRDMFISKKHFGLDSYLSTKIRHGTLDGQLFKPFTANNLTTTKNKADEFIINEYWDYYYYSIPDDKREKIQAALCKFSNDIDIACSEVKKKWIQVKTEKINSEGLFDYSFSNSELYDLFMAKYSSIENFGVFLDLIIKDLLERTEKNLDVIKTKIQTNLKNSFFSALNKIHEFFGDMFYRSKSSEMVNAIANCRTDIQNELDNLCRWFSFSQDKAIDSFDLSLVLETSEEVLFNIYGNRIKIHKNIEQDLLKGLDGRYFVHFVDIFYILLDNVIKHSLLDFELNDIRIQASSCDGILEMNMVNSLSEKFPFEENILKIKTICKEISDELNQEKWASEGESGFHKIIKIIKYDLRCRSYEFKFEPLAENLEFKVSFELMLDGGQ